MSKDKFLVQKIITIFFIYTLFLNLTLQAEEKSDHISKKALEGRLSRIKKGILENKGSSTPRYWVDAEDVPFWSSPDKRAGVKILIDRNSVGPTLVSLQKITFLPLGKLERNRYDSACIFYVLKGKVKVQLAEFPVFYLESDGAVLVPPQSNFQIFNAADGITEIIQFLSPSGPEQQFRSWQKAYKEENR
ncbi:hypothetical protein ACFL35_21840 [Candidatus Riflebacteria bacterium]